MLQPKSNAVPSTTQNLQTLRLSKGDYIYIYIIKNNTKKLNAVNNATLYGPSFILLRFCFVLCLHICFFVTLFCCCVCLLLLLSWLFLLWFCCLLLFVCFFLYWSFQMPLPVEYAVEVDDGAWIDDHLARPAHWPRTPGHLALYGWRQLFCKGNFMGGWHFNPLMPKKHFCIVDSRHSTIFDIMP